VKLVYLFGFITKKVNIYIYIQNNPISGSTKYL